ncbi:hypothetical protein [Streptomyces minutiscleroticus]|uniref:Uncharacterized protein n=1 Tax=Streptomyces minutiscleroticus TaxID=68238 RepID=A0A918KNB3_9ACTN|nr:hypothetical protein [Streptomyces minutiscleroticus]GGX69599.1 hypothetical protein GCM10010358_25120 [Streptomyces minutiscleroticus]
MSALVIESVKAERSGIVVRARTPDRPADRDRLPDRAEAGTDPRALVPLALT